MYLKCESTLVKRALPSYCCIVTRLGGVGGEVCEKKSPTSLKPPQLGSGQRCAAAPLHLVVMAHLLEVVQTSSHRLLRGIC